MFSFVPSCQGLLRITEVDFYIRGHRDSFVLGHLQAAVPGQRAPQSRWELTNLPAQSGDDNSSVFAELRESRELSQGDIEKRTGLLRC